MTTKKERAEALARMTKAELVKTIKALDARVTKLLNALNRSNELLEAAQAVAVALQRDIAQRNGVLGAPNTYDPPADEPRDVVGTVTGRLAPADRDVVKAALDGYEMQQADLQRDAAKAYNAERGHRMAFPWEQSLPNGFINPDDVPEE